MIYGFVQERVKHEDGGISVNHQPGFRLIIPGSDRLAFIYGSPRFVQLRRIRGLAALVGQDIQKHILQHVVSLGKSLFHLGLDGGTRIQQTDKRGHVNGRMRTYH